MGNEDDLNKEEFNDSEFSEVRKMLLSLRKVKAKDNFHSRLRQRIITELSSTNALDKSTDFITFETLKQVSKNKTFKFYQSWFFQRPVFTASVIMAIVLLIIFSIYNLNQSPQIDPVTTQQNQKSLTQPLVSDTLSMSTKEEVDKSKATIDKSLIAENTKVRKHNDSKFKIEGNDNKNLIKEDIPLPKPSNPIEEREPDANSKIINTKPQTSPTPKDPTAVDTKKEPTKKSDVLAMPKNDSNNTRVQKTKKLPKQNVKDGDVTKEQLEKIKEEILDKIKKD
jgi:uncharacterized membrane protein